MNTNKLINVNNHGRAEPPKRLRRESIILFEPLMLCTLTARQLREFVLPAQPSGFLSRLLVGSCHGGKPVWRSFCRHGARWFYHDGDISSKLLDDLIV